MTKRLREAVAVSCCVLGQGKARLPMCQGNLMQLRVFAYTMCPLPSAQRHRDCTRRHPPIQLSCLFSVFMPPQFPAPSPPPPHLPLFSISLIKVNQ